MITRNYFSVPNIGELYNNYGSYNIVLYNHGRKYRSLIDTFALVYNNYGRINKCSVIIMAEKIEVSNWLCSLHIQYNVREIIITNRDFYTWYL